MGDSFSRAQVLNQIYVETSKAFASGSASEVIFLDKSEYHLYCQLQCERGLLSNQRQLKK